ncbi:hypothetical protein SEA_ONEIAGILLIAN_89 [Microbacterium phage OneinaGillian]|uniref:Uncharacterized protein n=1 Tax=Microbacterium phage OneinaGillian TaxID=2301604 RepID=A0A385UJF3_9CAUD|nr:hypothetical protein HOU23_gp089 [Microbacterium phage OneinaGillian]AYB70199.1 hypothetical protein SEA_ONEIAGILLIAN_89 [Microbacterium phage OneinaGillian]
MDITTNDDWQWVGSEYKTAYATTSDPRVLAVIERDDEWGGGHVDGDIYAPAWYFDTWRGEINEAGSTFRDDASTHIMERLLEARGRFRYAHKHSDVMERWLKIFHETVLEQVKSSIDRETQVVILSTPTWREHVGGVAGDPLRKDALGGDVEAWEAALSGNVYGIGYATNESRLMDGDDIDFDAWTVDIESYGYLGEEYAKRAASDFEVGDPGLPEMLPLGDEPGFIEHTDRIANALADGR